MLELISPFAEWRLGQWCTDGAKKYGDRNWEKGLPMSKTLGSLKRHVNKFQQGDRSEDHLAAIMWNSMALIHTEMMIERGVLPDELNDLPNYEKNKTYKTYEELENIYFKEEIKGIE
jgi:hypothetical protein